VKIRGLALLTFTLAVGCTTATPPIDSTPASEPTAPSESSMPAAPAAPALPAIAPDIAARLSQLPLTPIDYDHSLLDANETRVLQKLIEVSQLIDAIYWRQVDERTIGWRASLAQAAATSAPHAEALKFFDIMKGPWDELKENDPFVLSAGKRPAGGGWYPLDMTKQEFEQWIAAHPQDKETFQGLNNVIRRQGGQLVAIPYSVYYRDQLAPAADKLREAAAMTKNLTLRNYLNKLATAFLDDNYFPSDVAWMDVESPIEVVIGPYEVYGDEMFNYKAGFESFVNVVDRPESEKLAVYAKHLADMERNLPMPDKYKNPNRGSDSPIRVVQEVYTAGDARHGVQTSAFNLPNDERVREAKGSKKVLLKNVMEAKYRQSGQPIAQRVLDPAQLPQLSFAAYFNHVLFHELSHGVGPGMITGPKGERVENRILLKELYSSIEECKADVLGVWNLLYAIDHKLNTDVSKEQLYVTNAALMFRSMRFGLDEAHGRGTAVQWNWYREHGAILPAADGRFRIDATKSYEAVKSLANELLLIEATGDYDRAKRLLDKYGVDNPEIEGVIARLKDIPVDIAPVFVAAGER
jgi:hypothetical protein